MVAISLEDVSKQPPQPPPPWFQKSLGALALSALFAIVVTCGAYAGFIAIK